MLNQQSEQLTAYGAELAESAKRIEEESAHLVQIEVAKPPQMAPKRAAGHERPTAATTWTGDTPGLG